jgi:nitrite reductase (NADH) large subunit
VLALVMLVSVGLFFAINAMSPLSLSMLTVGYGAVALNAFYWFAGPLLAGALTELTGVNAAWLRWVVSITVAVLTLLWIARTRVSELQFALTTGADRAGALGNAEAAEHFSRR